ncbi:hypothetical protein [Cribrihabitans pelagius]|uniref:hypothetical protein n=1 Tax=Cribrihabitans pelagius TaxID=1765746 RepID=UPI003B5BDA66
MSLKRLALALAGCTAVASCDTRPLSEPPSLSGLPGPSYQEDLTLCRAQAAQIGKGHISKTAALGAASAGIGTAVAVNSGNRAEKAAIGATLGLIAGAAAGDTQVKLAQRRHLVNCLQSRGHPLTG